MSELSILNWSGEILDHISTPIAYMDYNFRIIRVNQAFADFHHKPITFFSDHSYFVIDPHRQRETMFREAVIQWRATEFPNDVSVQHSYWRLACIRNHSQERGGMLLTMEPSLPKEDLGIPEPTVELSNRHTRKFSQFSLREQGVIFQAHISGIIEVSEGDCLALPEFSHGLAIGRNIFDVFQSWPEISHALYRASEGSVVRDTLTIHGINLDVFFAPYYDDAANIAGLIGVAIDANERKQYETRLIHAKKFLLKVIDSMPDLVSYKDENGYYLGCNKAFSSFIGMRKRNVLGKTDDALFSAKRALHLNNLHQQVIKTNKPHSLTEETVDYHDCSYTLETNEAPLLQGGRLSGTVTVSRKLRRK